MWSSPESNKFAKLLAYPRGTNAVENITPYIPVDRKDRGLFLDANEGCDFRGDSLNAYPNPRPLINELAVRFKIDPERVALGAGADDIIDRILRAYLDPTRTLTIATPTFEMIPKFAAATGASVNRIFWDHTYPLPQILAATEQKPGVIAVVSPNNPTGEVVRFEDVRRLATERPNSLIMLDLAYVEFADEDPTTFALEVPNVVVVRTFSKAWGLAGLRCGFALGDRRVIKNIRAVGSPYPVTAPTIDRVLRVLRTENVDEFVSQTRSRKANIEQRLKECDLQVSNSQANFVYASGKKAKFVGDALSAQDVFVRRFENAIRIGVPTTLEDNQRFEFALSQTIDPDAVLFDMDGVLVDVRESYRRAIVETCERFGVSVSYKDIVAAKLRGDANDDWKVTQNLIVDGGVEASLEEVTNLFEALYQETLWKNETALVDASLLKKVAQKRPIGIVTGRPKLDALRAIETFGWNGIFAAVVTREDAPLKPDPQPVQLALAQLGGSSAWFIGDTPDDIISGRAAGVLPIAVELDRRTRSALREFGVPVFENASEVLQWA